VSQPVRIVLLNGVGSVGKGSVAKSLQSIARGWFLHVAMDGFLDMLPERYFGDPEGMIFEQRELDGHPAIDIRTGPVVERALAGMRRAVAALAAEGNELIVDDVYTAREAADYAALLAPYRVYRVGLFAPLDVLEAREKARGDRSIGLARGQFDALHEGLSYDLELDTSRLSAMECAERIRDRFGL
jgi:chloramphenicol 3-O phosphotransferase